MAQAARIKLLRHLHAARSALGMNNLPLAEFHARLALELDPHSPLLESVFAGIRHGHGWPEDFALSEKSHLLPQGPRFLLIKAWGYGFWSEVHHLLSQLLLAELTHRTPIIHWGVNCLFRRADSEDAFSHFFEPVSSATLQDIPTDASFYPPKWCAKNLAEEDLNKWDGPHSRRVAQYFFSRPETVLVSDFFSTLSSIRPWIGRDSRYFGLSDDALYAELFRQHLKPKREILQRVAAFRESKLKGQPWVAVHVRGSDKILESAHLGQINSKYFDIIERIEKVTPDIGVFLLTDSEPAVAEFSAKYGERLCFAPARRSANLVGVHMSGSDGVENGIEVLVDALLSIACQYFIGNRESNVSMAISSMGQWGRGFIFLLGARNIRDDDVYIHDRLAWEEGRCRLCGSAVAPAFETTVLSCHPAQYTQCPGCGSLQSERPYWQASDESLAAEPARQPESLPRAVLHCTILRPLLPMLGVQPDDRCIDINPGEDHFARLMRDSGFHCFSLRGDSVFGAEGASLPRAKVVTLLGVLETFEEPSLAWAAIMSMQPDFIIGTLLTPEHSSADWPELRRETGERVFFHSVQALAMIATKHGYSPYTLGQFFLLTKTPVPDAMAAPLTQWSTNITSATIRSVLNWLQQPLTASSAERVRLGTLSRLAQRPAAIGLDMSRLPARSPRRRLWMSVLREWALDGFARHLVVFDSQPDLVRLPGVRLIDCAEGHPALPLTIACDQTDTQPGSSVTLLTQARMALGELKISFAPTTDFSRPSEAVIARFKTLMGLEQPYLLVGDDPPAALFSEFLQSLDGCEALPMCVVLAPHAPAWQGQRVQLRALDLDDADLQSAYSGAHATLVFFGGADALMVPLEASSCGCPVVVCRTPEEIGAALTTLAQLFEPAVRALQNQAASAPNPGTPCCKTARRIEEQLVSRLLDPHATP